MSFIVQPPGPEVKVYLYVAYEGPQEPCGLRFETNAESGAGTPFMRMVSINFNLYLFPSADSNIPGIPETAASRRSFFQSMDGDGVSEIRTIGCYRCYSDNRLSDNLLTLHPAGCLPCGARSRISGTSVS